MKKITLSIPEPCDKKWPDMADTGTAGCRFCDRCEKQIRDFTHLPDAEIAQFFKKKDSNICGKFRPYQLNRPIRTTTRPAIFGRAAGLVFGGILAATTQESCMGKVQDTREQIEATAMSREIIGDTTYVVKIDSPEQKPEPKALQGSPEKCEIMGKPTPEYWRKHHKKD